MRRSSSLRSIMIESELTEAANCTERACSFFFFFLTFFSNINGNASITMNRAR